jgi:hypothetical protein
MTMTRIALAGGVVVLAGVIVLLALADHQILAPLLTVIALGVLIGCGNLLYGKNSHYARAQARNRPAQEAQNRAIDEARRQAALHNGEADPA